MKHYEMRPRDLVKLTKYDKSTISKILLGKYDPKLSILNDLLDAVSKFAHEVTVDSKMRKWPELTKARIDESIKSVIPKLQEFDQVPVEDGDRFVGMVTSDSMRDRLPEARTAGDILGANYALVYSKDSIERVRRLLSSLGFQAAIVIQRGKPVGLVTNQDLFL